MKEIFHAAVEQPENERAAFLDRACGRDSEMRRSVEELLACDESMGEFLVHPAVDPRSPMDSPENRTGRHVGPYQLITEIGHGGMGTVYLAERADGQYHKRVAIKVISPHLVTTEALRRFRNERQVEAALEHANIARLLDGGATEDGLPYLVMEYVEGVRIDTWCDARKLPVRDRLTLFRQVCAAVQYAHDKGIIHRDIKPGNILVTADGIPKLLDFGVAKVLNRQLSNEAETTAGPGPMTPEYASPEQMHGEPIAPGSDIYALGVVLYRLLTGQIPFSLHGLDAAQAGRVNRENELPKPSAVILFPDNSAAAEMRGESPRRLRRKLAGELDNIVLKALRKEPERRYASVAQFSDDIARYLDGLPVKAHGESPLYRAGKLVKRNQVPVMAAMLTAVLVLTLVAVWGRFAPAGGTAPAGMSIAVLPLENLSGDRTQEYFSDGITDELINELARIRALRVISLTSVMSFKGARRRLPDIARSLGVQTIAEGSVLGSADRLRISIRLVDAAKDRLIWSASYEGRIEDVLSVQAQVARGIAGEIHAALTASDQARLGRNRRVNLEAYNAYLSGRYQYFRGYTLESTQKAIALFQHALELDPSYAPAYVGLAGCYWGLSSVYYPPTEVMPKAKWAAQKAIDLDDTLGEAHALLALVRSSYEFNPAEAGNGFERAIELKPSDGQAHLLYAIHLAEVGRSEEAMVEVEQAQKLDPVSPFLSGYAGPVLYFAHRYDELIQRLQTRADLHPEEQQSHAFLALAYEQKGDNAKAVAEMEKAYGLEKDLEALAQLGHIYAVSGRTADARRVLRQLRQLSAQRYVSAYNIGVLYTGLGERDEAFRWLGKVEQDRSEWFAAINVDPRLDTLHSDPRFTKLLQKVGLAK